MSAPGTKPGCCERVLQRYWPVNLIVGVFLANAAALLLLPDWKGFYENAKILLLVGSAFLFFSSLSAALFCRYKMALRQRIPYSAVFQVGGVATIWTMVWGCLAIYGQRLFTTDCWLAVWQSRLAWIGVCSFGFMVSVLAALAVTVYYRRRQ